MILCDVIIILYKVLTFFFFLMLFVCCTCVGKVYNYGWGLSPSSWSWGGSGLSPKMSNNNNNGFGKMVIRNEMVRSDLASCGGGDNNGSHCSTVERLYAWEKKLFEEVKVRSPIFLSKLTALLTFGAQECIFSSLDMIIRQYCSFAIFFSLVGLLVLSFCHSMRSL